MKRTRKGFTLVELLIVITILGTLAAAMSSSTGNATARAKAASIVANVEACKTAAAIFYNDHWDDATVKVNGTDTDMAETTAAAFLYDDSTYIPNWADFAKAGGNVVFSIETDEKGRDNWAIKVDFSKDAEASNVAYALSKIKGYSGMYTAATEATGTEGQEGYVPGTAASSKTSFTVTLTTGKVTASN